ncbi:MAG: hypothetical protein LV468_02825 [Candidatus Nitrosotenuis sp.]|uniref:hypothetical protein n=1 Tax=Candidatus Nitrosotenuis cloacae TaxID=1603555 RepID=UPI002280B6CC|nr:hypothetical protein [Candidatus Nitrosotenuis cloacae]MDC8437917.1 hypothetical protein [Candidatus Nitrosotenuis sp.]
MDKKLEDKINEKIRDAISGTSEIDALAKSMDSAKAGDKSFRYGVIVGRLYNSFYYQCRRILKRDPTDGEFAEFVEILAKRRDEILKNL